MRSTALYSLINAPPFSCLGSNYYKSSEFHYFIRQRVDNDYFKGIGW